MALPNRSGLLSIVALALVVTVVVLLLKETLAGAGFSVNVLLAGNALLFAITVLAYLVASRAVRHPNTNVFMRAIVGSIMLKMFLAAIAAFAYIFANRKGLNKPALFTTMGLYLVYTFMMVGVLMKMLRGKQNG